MTPIQRAAAERLAFEQWYDAQPDGRISPWDVWQAAALLRELLAEPQGEPVQEPVAWIHRAQYLLAHAENSPPADKMLENGWEPLYAAPQQRKPLTREQIDTVWSSLGSFTDRESDYRIFARAIERAHGITGEPT